MRKTSKGLFFTEETSYQGLKYTTSFGLLYYKSAMTGKLKYLPILPLGVPSLCSVLRIITMSPHLPLPRCKKGVKLGKKYEGVDNMSNVKKLTTWTMEEVYKKK